MFCVLKTLLKMHFVNDREGVRVFEVIFKNVFAYSFSQRKPAVPSGQVQVL